eukprot:6212517-Pleurochrysis_carterae.AAC.9
MAHKATPKRQRSVYPVGRPVATRSWRRARVALVSAHPNEGARAESSHANWSMAAKMHRHERGLRQICATAIKSAATATATVAVTRSEMRRRRAARASKKTTSTAEPSASSSACVLTICAARQQSARSVRSRSRLHASDEGEEVVRLASARLAVEQHGAVALAADDAREQRKQQRRAYILRDAPKARRTEGETHRRRDARTHAHVYTRTQPLTRNEIA